MNRTLPVALAVACAVLPATRFAQSAGPSAADLPPRRSLEDYKHFRVTAIDLLGRMPTREEIAELEQPDFDWNKWVDAHLSGPAYADRLTRVYMDVLRLEPNLNFSSGPAQLYRYDVLGPDGKSVPVYYRQNQRRERPETDGEFCLSPDEIGGVVRPNRPIATPRKVSQATLDTQTVLVKPWWLYRDYRTPSPTQLYGAAWKDPDPQYKPVESLLKDAAGNPVAEVRVCREEAENRETGHIYASGRTKPPAKDAKLPGGRDRPPPLDKPYATQHQGQEVRCEGKAALDYAPDCGCGVGLARCIPGDRTDQGAAAFYFPIHMPLGAGMPLDDARQQAQRWFPYWWSREAVRFLDDLFEQDRDFREILTSKRTFVNGPLAQFYKTIQRGSCCGPEANFGMVEETEPLFDPKNVPEDLEPSDVSAWKAVEDRGPHAAGILTMPMFLEKYASARARGAALYNDFLAASPSSRKTSNSQRRPSRTSWCAPDARRATRPSSPWRRTSPVWSRFELRLPSRRELPGAHGGVQAGQERPPQRRVQLPLRPGLRRYPVGDAAQRLWVPRACRRNAARCRAGHRQIARVRPVCRSAGDVIVPGATHDAGRRSPPRELDRSVRSFGLPDARPRPGNRSKPAISKREQSVVRGIESAPSGSGRE